MLNRIIEYIKYPFKSDNNTIKALMIKGFSTTLLLKLYYAGSALLISILLARFLGVQEFGLYYYALSWVLILGILAKLGLSNVVVKNVAAYNANAELDKMKGIFIFSSSSIIIISLFLSLIAITFTSTLSLDEHEKTVLYLAFLLLPVRAVLVPVGSIQSGLQRIFHAQFPAFFIQPTVFVVFISIIWFSEVAPFTAETAILALLLATLLGLVVGVFFLKKNLPTDIYSVKAKYESKKWLKSGLALMLAGSMVTLNANADIAMLGIFSGMDSAGIYKAAARGAEFIYFILSVVAVPLSPLIAKLYAENDHAKLQKLVSKSARIGFFAGLLVAVPLMLMSTWFLSLFGGEFIIGSVALQILCIGQLINVFAGPSDYLLMMSGHEKQVAIAMSGAAVLNISLNLLLIPAWGIEGAALATALSTAAMRISLLYFSKRYLAINSTGF